jgi:Xaa-Pro aminopeptidase
VTPQAHRRARLAAALGAREADAALVTGAANVRYLTGLASSNAAVLVGRDGSAVLATDGRYLEQAALSAPGLELLDDRRPAWRLARHAASEGGRSLAVETHVLTVDEHASLADADGRLELTPLGRAVEDLRVAKDDGEVALMRAAAALADAALEGLLATGGVRTGRTEREVAADLEARMRAAGGDGPSFDTIVAAGPRGALPHARPGPRELAPGDLVVLDFGTWLDGYASDCTRTVAVAPVADWQRDLHALVGRAHDAGIAALRPGADLSAVDAAARDVIVAAGRGASYPHGLGHGVGLEIHEAPPLGPAAVGRLVDRAVVTVEPGVYLPGRGGVRTEDLLVVTPTGPELLTTTTAELRVLP